MPSCRASKRHYDVNDPAATEITASALWLCVVIQKHRRRSITSDLSHPALDLSSLVKQNAPIVMDNAVGCYAYGNMFCWLLFKLYLGSSDDISN